MAKQNPGIFALEGDWSEDMRAGGSMRPVFEMLSGQDAVEVVHRDVGTTAELQYYASKWNEKRYSHFFLAYLAFHGNPGKLWVGDDHISMEQLADLLGDACRGRVVHFGACSTVRVPAARLAEFKKETGAAAVSGYQRDVDWLESCAFEILLLGALAHYPTSRGAFGYVGRTLPDLAKRLGWHHV